MAGRQSRKKMGQVLSYFCLQWCWSFGTVPYMFCLLESWERKRLFLHCPRNLWLPVWRFRKFVPVLWVLICASVSLPFDVLVSLYKNQGVGFHRRTVRWQRGACLSRMERSCLLKLTDRCMWCVWTDIILSHLWQEKYVKNYCVKEDIKNKYKNYFWKDGH